MILYPVTPQSLKTCTLIENNMLNFIVFEALLKVVNIFQKIKYLTCKNQYDDYKGVQRL